MSLQELGLRQINEALSLAVEKRAPVTLTIRQDDTWLTLASRFVAISGNRLVIELPVAEGHNPQHEFALAEKIGLAFKIKHHKHIFTATVAGVMEHKLDDGTGASMLAFCLPSRMQRLQRRMYYRADVPPNRVVRTSIWTGGRDSEPDSSRNASPIWSGRIVNLSAGGFQMVMPQPPSPTLEVGESMGVRIAFGNGQETVFADAQFRHIKQEGADWSLGFQFVALTQTPEGREALHILSQKISEFQHAAKPSAQAS